MLDEDIQKKLDDAHVVLDNLRIMKVKYADLLPEDTFDYAITQAEECRDKYSEMLYPSC